MKNIEARRKRQQRITIAIIASVILISALAGFLIGQAVTRITYLTAFAVDAPVMVTEELQSGYISLGEFELTAYCPCTKCCGKSDGITASGTKATQGRTMACDKSIPFGTKLIINGNEYICEDRGGAIKGNRIDIYFDSHADAKKFGRQTAEVFMGGRMR